MSTLNNIYDWILEGIQDLGNQKGDVQLQEYLESLQPYVKNLRQSYKNQHISVDYTDEKTQFAYLLTYYPQYVEMTRQILEKIDLSIQQSIFSFQKHLNICLFGAGAAPEAIGLVSFIKDNYPNIQSLTIRAFDISSGTWRLSQDITKNYIIPQIWDGRIVLPTYLLDLCQDKVFVKLKNIINCSQIFIFQNCLNELQSSSTVLNNIEFLIEEMPSNSILIIADLRIYANTIDIKNNLELLIRNLNDLAKDEFNEPFYILRSPQEGITDFRTSLNLPPIIKNYLLIGKPGEPPTKNGLLTPRKNIKCNFFSAYKLYSEEINLPALETEHSLDWNDQLTTIEQTLTRKIDNTISQIIREQRKTLLKEIQQLRKIVIITSLLGGISLLIAILSLFK